MQANDFYTIEEWQTLQLAPIWVAAAVAAADGKIDEKENETLNRELKIIIDKVFIRFIHLTQEFEEKGRKFPKDHMEFARMLIESGWSLLDAVMSSAPLKSTKDNPWSVQLERLYCLDSRNAFDGLADVADILERKTTLEDSREFKEFLLRLGQKIIEASGSRLIGRSKKKKRQKAYEVVARALKV